MMSTETLAVAFVGVACFTLFWLWIHPFLRWERRLLWLSFFLHAIASGALYYITVHVYGIGDMLRYGTRGLAIARAMSTDLSGGIVGITSMLFGHGGTGAFAAIAGAPATRFTALVGGLTYVAGSSLVSAAFLLTTSASLSMVSLYGALKLHVDRRLHLRLLVGVMFTPTVLLWSSGLLKEAVAVVALGFAVSGFARWMRLKAWPRLFQAVVWGIVLFGFKPYVAIALVVGVLTWVIMTLPSRRKRVLMAGVLVGAVILIVSANSAPRYAQTWAVRFAEQQELALSHPGGSTVSWGVAPSTSVLGQLANLPAAMLNVWTRPWPSDVRNPMSAFSSLQMLVLLGIVVSALSRHRWRGIVRMVSAMPVLGFCIVFGFVESIAVGLGSLNLGSIDRYRAPALLLVVPALLVLQGRHSVTSQQNLSIPRTKHRSRSGTLRAPS